jgi:hypothetical protein
MLICSMQNRNCPRLHLAVVPFWCCPLHSARACIVNTSCFVVSLHLRAEYDLGNYAVLYSLTKMVMTGYMRVKLAGGTLQPQTGQGGT